MWLSFSKSSQTFSVDLLNNYIGLERYMSGEHELKAIEALSKKPKALQRPTLINPYFGKRQILWINLAYPLNALISSVFSTVAFILNSIWLKHYAAFFEVASRQMTRQWEQVADQWNTKSPMLVPALNAPKMSAWDVYTCADYLTGSVGDLDVKALTHKHAVLQEEMDNALDRFYEGLDKSRANQGYVRWAIRKVASVFFTRKMERSAFKIAYAKSPGQAVRDLKETYSWDQIEKPNAMLYKTLLSNAQGVNSYSHVQLYNRRGDCRGGSEWFIRLLLKSERFFRDPEKHLMAVAKQFENGISGQGIVLNALLNCSALLGEKVTMMNDHTISTFDLDLDRASALKKINSLPTGIYRVGVFEHSLVHIKLPSGESYTWDPNYGLYEHDADTFLNFVLKHHYVRENPSSHIYFEKHASI